MRKVLVHWPVGPGGLPTVSFTKVELSELVFCQGGIDEALVVLHEFLTFVAATVSEFSMAVPHRRFGVFVHLSLPFGRWRARWGIDVTTRVSRLVALLLTSASLLHHDSSLLSVHLDCASLWHLSILINDKVHEMIKLLLDDIVGFRLLELLRTVVLILLLLLLVQLVEVCPHNLGVLWNFRHILALFSVSLPFLEIKLRSSKTRFFELLFEIFLLLSAPLFVLGRSLIMSMFAMLKHIVIEGEFVYEMSTFSLVYLHYLVFKGNYYQWTTLKREHQQVVDEIRNCRDLGFPCISTLPSQNHCL
jgi:hypothetical protein